MSTKSEAVSVEEAGYARLMAERSEEAFVITDPQGQALWANRRFSELTEYSVEELIGRKPGELLQGPTTCPNARSVIRKALASGRSCRLTVENYTKSRRRYWVDLRIDPVLDEHGGLIHFVALQRDISEDARATGTSRDLDAFKAALDQQAIVSVADRRGRITFANENFCRMSGYGRDELIGKNHRIVNSGHHPKEFFAEMWRMISSGAPWRAEIANKAKSGALYWVDTTIVPVRDADGQIERYVSIRYDVTERKAAETALKRLAQSDSLTGLVNRTVLKERIERALSGASAAGQMDADDTWSSPSSRPRDADPEDAARAPAAQREGRAGEGALILLDMDHFKDINDTLGHDVGDDILCEIARRLRRNVRDSDTVARLGGDEFAILASGFDSSEGCAAFVERLLDHLSSPIRIGAQLVAPSFSIGVARYPRDAGTARDLLRRADIAMYEAKRGGRAQWTFFDRAAGDRHEMRQSIAADIRAGLERDEFWVALQPQIDLSTGAHRGFEALARWGRGADAQSPARFIPVAEESTLIGPLGRVLLEKALRAYAAIRECGLVPGVLSVNVAGPQLRSDDFSEFLAAACAAHRIAPEELEIELTETALIGRSSSKVAANLARLKAFGASIALDDFGTGQSSLTHLKEFPVDVLKIDGSFVRDIETDQSDARLVRAIAALARELDIAIVAEGVENAQQEAFLRRHGCQYGQGYLYARPLQIECAVDYLRTPRRPV